jgi:hypothetical protein
MFDWFRKSSYTSTLPLVDTPKVPYIEIPKQEQEYYSIGITSDNRMTFKTGISTLTMSRKGCADLIEQLTVFMNQLPESTND